MRNRKGCQSEASRSKTVMKKWLNMKPKVFDFSEDENDTESESDDDAESVNICKDHGLRAPENESVDRKSRSRETGRKQSLRHRRGKSETLRVQYISTKDVRVTVGTWNVAGNLPGEDIKIDEWLIINEPADVYILGFQEVVPLNAGNVFGAEDSRPLPKWDAIIRKTLNKTSLSKTKLECFSAPPSPVFGTSADIIADEHVVNAANISKEQSLKLNNATLDWPERPLDDTFHIYSSFYKLRRVSTGSGAVGFGRMADSLYFSSQSSPLNDYGDIDRLGSLQRQQQQQTRAESVNDMSDDLERFSWDDDDPLPVTPEMEPDIATEEERTEYSRGYVRIISKQMVGIYVSVWVRRGLRRHLNNLKVSPVGVGLMGYMGNKGSVSISMSLFQSRLCFVCSHLASGQKDGDELRRNFDVHEIIRRTQFSTVFDSDQSQTIPSHDQIFWFGDLNYRLNMPDAQVRNLIAKKHWADLINNDQLSIELRKGHVFDGWKEGAIHFPPTYKYEINTDRYVGEKATEGDKSRSPAWCDRILWLGKGIKQLSYKASDIRLSDHRPVSSVFVIEVEVIDPCKLQRVINLTNVPNPIHTDVFIDKDERVRHLQQNQVN